MDWGAGHYETIAAQLLPAAQAVVDDAKLRTGERALDARGLSVEFATGEAAEILREANEDPDAFRATSRYLVYIATRS